MINLLNVKKTYNKDKSNEFIALKNINLTIAEGESVAIVGQSGAGKSTLLNLLRAKISITEGEILYDEFNIKNASYNEICNFKRDNIANIYQDYFLLEELTVYENIELPLCIKKMKKSQRLDKCVEIIKKVGLEEMFKKRVSQLSGGEKQRVAIARALAVGAKYIMADEPTGALDVKNSLNIMNLLFELNKEGKTLIYVTHEPSLAELASRVITISDGEITSDIKKEIVIATE